jgi:hypothetical protein
LSRRHVYPIRTRLTNLQQIPTTNRVLPAFPIERRVVAERSGTIARGVGGAQDDPR